MWRELGFARLQIYQYTSKIVQEAEPALKAYLDTKSLFAGYVVLVDSVGCTVIKLQSKNSWVLTGDITRLEVMTGEKHFLTCTRVSAIHKVA